MTRSKKYRTHFAPAFPLQKHMVCIIYPCSITLPLKAQDGLMCVIIPTIYAYCVSNLYATLSQWYLAQKFLKNKNIKMAFFA